jgi:hypothetical protein
MRKLIAAAAVVAAGAGSFLGSAGRADAMSVEASVTGDPTTALCVTVTWDLPDPTGAAIGSLPPPPVAVPVAPPDPFSFTTGGQCVGPNALPV